MKITAHSRHLIWYFVFIFISYFLSGLSVCTQLKAIEFGEKHLQRTPFRGVLSKYVRAFCRISTFCFYLLFLFAIFSGISFSSSFFSLTVLHVISFFLSKYNFYLFHFFFLLSRLYNVYFPSFRFSCIFFMFFFLLFFPYFYLSLKKIPSYFFIINLYFLQKLSFFRFIFHSFFSFFFLFHFLPFRFFILLSFYSRTLLFYCSFSFFFLLLQFFLSVSCLIAIFI